MSFFTKHGKGQRKTRPRTTHFRPTIQSLVRREMMAGDVDFTAGSTTETEPSRFSSNDSMRVIAFQGGGEIGDGNAHNLNPIAINNRLKYGGKDGGQNPPLSPEISVQGSQILIHGTDAAQIVEVNQNGNTIEVDVYHSPHNPPVVSASFSVYAVSEVNAWLYGGGDNYVNNTNLIDFVWGGDGEDILEGGNGASFLIGGEDDDYLIGHGGPDMLSGNGGVDFLLGGSYSDSPHDGAVDSMNGGEGDDVVIMPMVPYVLGGWVPEDWRSTLELNDDVTYVYPPMIVGGGGETFAWIGTFETIETVDGQNLGLKTSMPIRLRQIHLPDNSDGSRRDNSMARQASVDPKTTDAAIVSFVSDDQDDCFISSLQEMQAIGPLQIWL